MILRDPYWLLLGVLIPAIFFLLMRRRQFGSLRFPSLKHFRSRRSSLRIMMLPLVPLLRISGIGFLIFAMARPQEGTEIKKDFSKGVSIMMATDISGSMRAMDFFIDGKRVNRLDAVKHVFRSFVEGSGELAGRPYDEIGLVAFGGFAISRAPTTLDHGALLDILDQVTIPEQIIDKQRGRVLNAEELSTAIGDGLALSVARVKETKAQSKVVILLSDGVNNAGDVTPEEAARAAKEFGIKVYTIGIGHTGTVPMPGYNLFGNPQLIASRVEFDATTLKKIAEVTGGTYFHAEDTEALTSIYKEIDTLEKSELESKIFMLFNELFPLYLLIGASLLLFETLLSHTFLRRIP